MSEDLNFQIHDNGHHILSPSGWDGWSRCTGMMVGLNEARKKGTDAIASVEGTTGHTLLELSLLNWVCPTLITGKHITDSVLEDVTKWANKIANNINNTDEVRAYGKECFRQIVEGDFTDEMRIEIKKCYDRIKVYKDDGWVVLPESKVSLFAYFGHKHCDGTSDIIMYKGGKLIVADLKYGKGIEVSPENSGQLSLYGGGAMAAIYKETGKVFEEIELVIMQPRINNGVWKSWTWHYSGEDGLYAFLMMAKDKSIAALEALQGGKVVFDPSEKSCMWCHRKKNCKARMDFAGKAIKEAFVLAGVVEDSLDRPAGIDNMAISKILDRAPFITSFLNDMAVEAEARAMRGEVIPHRKLVKGRASRKWVGEKTLGELFNSLEIFPEDYLVIKVKSPAQMEKVQLTDEQRTAVKGRIAQSFGKEALVSENDKRHAVIKNPAHGFELAGVVIKK